jgi:integrase/recombinase XerD
MTLLELFQLFLRERRYIKNSSENTIYFYENSLRAYQRVMGDAFPTKQACQDFVIKMRELGIKPASCNVYIRGMNSFLGWMFENEHLPEKLSIKQLKCEQRVMKTFTDEQLKALVSWKPQTFQERRLHTLICLLIDTGIRIDEALTLQRSKVDFDNLLMTVIGKGAKERLIPISIELRKVLFHFLKRHEFELVFCSRDGGKLLYDNMRRDLQRLLNRLGIEGIDGSFHAFRRKFAKSYVKNGGNVFYLMKQLGHTSLAMSKRYCEVDAEDLALVHKKASILSRLK